MKTDCLIAHFFLTCQGFQHYTVNYLKFLVSFNRIHTNCTEDIFGIDKKLRSGYHFRSIGSKTLNLFLAE